MKIGKKKDKNIASAKNSNKNSVNVANLSDKNKFAIVESYKVARTNIMFSLAANEKKVFAVTSYSKGEGKSTASSNLAISFSKMGKKVLLIDADMRRSNIHNIFKLNNSAGLSNVVSKMISFEEAVKCDVITDLDVLVAGTIPPNPSELMCSNSFIKMIEKLTEKYEYIIIDTPPVGVVADALLLKDLIAGFVVVVREKVTTHRDLSKLLESMKLADTKVLGLVEVGCDISARKGKKKYYYYQYY
ncbi:MAG TPA: capsular biosynthesis protein [Ruminococcus sp.]|nr:capsular biosynthesis protein [Ruminococcus sp.]